MEIYQINHTDTQTQIQIHIQSITHTPKASHTHKYKELGASFDTPHSLPAETCVVGGMDGWKKVERKKNGQTNSEKGVMVRVKNKIPKVPLTQGVVLLLKTFHADPSYENLYFSENINSIIFCWVISCLHKATQERPKATNSPRCYPALPRNMNNVNSVF